MSTPAENAFELYTRLDHARKAGDSVLTRSAWLKVAEDFLRELQPQKPNGKQRDELFDALALACGINPLEATKALCATIAVAKADILSVTPGLTAEEIRRRADGYRRKHKDWPLTVSSLAKYWGEFGPSTGQTFAAKQGLPPEGWEQAFHEIGQLQDIEARSISYQISLGWDKLTNDLRNAINKRLGR